RDTPVVSLPSQPATTEIYRLSLHDALPISPAAPVAGGGALGEQLDNIERDAIVKALEQTRYNKTAAAKLLGMTFRALRYRIKKRSEEHTSELQSRENLVCRLLLEKKN